MAFAFDAHTPSPDTQFVKCI
ncbi:uncharacterized protein G2W53_013924 [Senna tora]|uniref:Uncharacterized protein n=1 Tax=Senna tora TaxID=362788 RepID=A0A834WSD5_9FABA|nr:uncharacterized protein G2W53_013924 [Senna tora]